MSHNTWDTLRGGLRFLPSNANSVTENWGT